MHFGAAGKWPLDLDVFARLVTESAGLVSQ